MNRVEGLAILKYDGCLVVPQNRSHHFVPQFYLRRFGGGGRVAMYNLRLGRCIPTASIAGQCQRPYLYGREPTVENALCEIEGQAAALLAAAANDSVLPEPYSEADAALVRFIAYQWGRTPAAADAANAGVAKLVRAVGLAPGVPGEIRDSVDQVRVGYRDPVLFSLAIAGFSGPLLGDLQRCILRNRSSVEFITSDAPVVLHNAWCEGVTWRGAIRSLRRAWDGCHWPGGYQLTLRSWSTEPSTRRRRRRS